jgi:predicted esterase
MSAREQRLTVQKTARYYQLGEPGPATREVWICCHGYGQLAGRFIRDFEPSATPSRVIVAPEGLHRFYLDPADRPAADRRVGATWMTREDRETDIADYVRYLDVLSARLLNDAPTHARLVGFGFSQGTATIARWAATTHRPLTRIILWGSGLPPDLDWSLAAARLQRLQVTLAVGDADAFVSAQQLVEQEALLRGHGIPFHTARFAGGHHLDADTLKQICAE